MCIIGYAYTSQLYSRYNSFEVDKFNSLSYYSIVSTGYNIYIITFDELHILD